MSRPGFAQGWKAAASRSPMKANIKARLMQVSQLACDDSTAHHSFHRDTVWAVCVGGEAGVGFGSTTDKARAKPRLSCSSVPGRAWAGFGAGSRSIARSFEMWNTLLMIPSLSTSQTTNRDSRHNMCATQLWFKPTWRLNCTGIIFVEV